MRYLLLVLLFTFSVSANDSLPSRADYIIEIGVLTIEGEAASSLYLSLNAQEKLDRLVTSQLQVREKKNKFASCRVSYFRSQERLGEENEWEMQEDAICKLTAPRGTVIK